MVNAGGTLVDVPATGDNGDVIQKISQNLPQQVRLPDLKPWGLNFQGARLIVVDGRPGAQLEYTTDNKAIGPLALIISRSDSSTATPSEMNSTRAGVASGEITAFIAYWKMWLSLLATSRNSGNP